MIIDWTQDTSIISDMTISLDLEDTLGVSNWNLEKEAPRAAIVHTDFKILRVGQGKSRLSRAFLQARKGKRGDCELRISI